MTIHSGVDWSNPLSRDLVAAFVPTTGQPINLVSGAPTTRTTGDLTRRSTEKGPAWYVTRAEDVVIATDVQPVLGPDHTMLALAAHREGVFATSQFYLSARSAENKGFAFYISHPGGDYRKIGYAHGGVAARDSAEITWPLNTWSAVAVTSSTAAGNVNFYFKGSLVNTTTIGAMIPTADKVHIGNDIFFTGDFGLGADVAVILYWRRRLSDAEMAAISADPFQIFRPAVRRFAFDVESGGGTITGTASGLLEALAGSASGSFTPLAITGTASAALEAVAAAASGDFTPSGVTGTASATLAMFEADASGAYTPMLVSGSAAAILDPLSADAAGTFFGLFTGTGVADIAALTADAAGSFAEAGIFSGSGAAVIAAISGTANGTFYGAFTGTAAGALEPITAAGSGTFLAAITGGGAAAIAQIEASAGGWVTITGTGAATFGPLTGYGAGTFTRLSVTVGRIHYAYAARSRRTATATPHIFTSTARH